MMTSHCHCGAQPVAVARDFQEAEALVVDEDLVAPVAVEVLVVLEVLVVDEVEGAQDCLVGLVFGRC